MGEDKEPKSPTLKQLIIILEDALKRAKNNECSEAEVIGMISRFNSESKGFVDNHSTVNYDKAQKMLGIKSRNELNDLCKAYCVEQVKINNQPSGFLISEIESLKPIVKHRKKEGK